MPNESDNGGCGCLSLILATLALDALWFGLPTPWGTLNDKDLARRALDSE